MRLRTCVREDIPHFGYTLHPTARSQKGPIAVVEENEAVIQKFVKVNPVKDNPVKDNPVKEDPAEVNSSKVNPSKVNPSKVNPSKVNPSKVNPAKVKREKVDPAKVHASSERTTTVEDIDIEVGRQHGEKGNNHNNQGGNNNENGKGEKKMIKKLAYHIVAYIFFALHLKLFILKVFYPKWTWDMYHIYFCLATCYVSLLTIYATAVFCNLKTFDLKNYPVEEIQSCKNYANKKNLHPYVSMERLDLINMSFIKLLYGAMFMAPWKIISYFIIATANILCCFLCSLFMGESKQHQESVILRIYVKFLQFICRVALWLFGVNELESHYLCDMDWPKNIVANHVSVLDTFYFISECACSFVAKKSLRKDVFVGLSVTALRCVFVYREKSEDRKIALESIKERQRMVEEKKNNFPSFVIFSEGTTSNGMQLIEQKKGAFSSLLPVTPVLLVYDYDFFNPAYDILPFTWWLILIASNYQSMSLKTYWLPKVYPPDKKKFPNMTEEERINVFHDEVSRIMFQNMKKYNPKAPQDIDDYNDWPGSLRIKLEFFQASLGNIATKYLMKEKCRSEEK
ncbi:acetyltransferase [Plasmodium inui San Antonio 1]|uniref:Acetyltransferase n=1 Tax=Plasmodium inui San Antonio 1 TaxID=1237626 RepID=W7A8D2_9APIC|nr:acetyltransferase [Plasmodium inui San Antonio 1]EUD67965.1 acetyltransferase [Plasmodium inui San Antonio 1]